MFFLTVFPFKLFHNLFYFFVLTQRLVIDKKLALKDNVEPLQGVAVSRVVEMNFFSALGIARYSLRGVLRGAAHQGLRSLSPSAGSTSFLSNSIARGSAGPLTIFK